MFLPCIADRGRRWLLERSALTRSLSVSPSLADSTYLSLSLLLLGDPFLGNVLAGAGAASSLCIPPAKQAPKATCRQTIICFPLPRSGFSSSRFCPVQPPPCATETARWAPLADLFFFSSSCGKRFFQAKGGGKSLHYYLHYLEVHFVFWPPGGLFLQESGCWERDRLLPRSPAPPTSLKASYLLRAPGASPAKRVCACLLRCVRVCRCVCVCVCVCERVRGVGWKLLCSSGTERIPGPGGRMGIV